MDIKAKRVNFVNIQQSHTVFAEGYHAPQVRTGYEYVIPYRTGNMFSYVAKGEGKILSKSNNAIVIEYKNGAKEKVEIGRRFGRAEGSIYPHNLVCEMGVGDSIKDGDIVVYNENFFEKDNVFNGGIMLKNSLSATVVLYESPETIEDSSTINERISNLLKTKVTKEKSITVGFKQNVHKVVKEGDQIEPDDILMLIEDEITSTTNSFDEKSLEVLRRISGQSPLAKYKGVVDRIEVRYHGDKDDMSISLRQLADRSDRRFADLTNPGEKALTGKVNFDYRIAGKPLPPDNIEIKIFITLSNGAGVGDKMVIANQMKSIISEVTDYSITTESGRPIDVRFSCRSIAARITNSPIMIGTTTLLLNEIAKKAISFYED